MKQPKIYNNVNELIDWLKYDLKEQRIEIAKGRGISKDDVKDEELVLHIGNKNYDFDPIDLLNQQNIKYNIYLNFNYILKKINNNKYILKVEGKNYQVCKYRINARHCIFNLGISTFNVIFEQELNFLKSSFSISNKQNNDVGSHFAYCHFNNELIFKSCLLNANFTFVNCIFRNDAEFNCMKSNCKIDIDFNNMFIKGALLIANNTIENTINISFNNIFFDNSKSLLSIKDITNTIDSISLKDVYVNGRINIQNVKVDTVDFKGSVINGGLVNPVNFEVDKFANRESALFLKNEAYARNNVIDALEYKAKEIDLHRKKPKKRIIRRKKL